jgi:uncharacterized protein (TIGR02266 family)
MMNDQRGFDGRQSGSDDLIEIDLNFESMRRFQAEFSPNLSEDGLFIDTGEPLSPGSVVRFRVILPEDFVFLEGTSVVEWTQSAEEAGEHPPGMALRFVTLSPQNQELVGQLVQDHLDAGGTPFDIDFRPVPSDFPTDALEGTPAPVDAPRDEGYRLTVRRTEPKLEAEAFRALAEAVPGAAGSDVPETPETAGEEPEEPRGFEVVSGPVDVSGDEETTAAVDAAVGVGDRTEEAVEEDSEPIWDDVAEAAIDDAPADAVAEVVEDDVGDEQVVEDEVVEVVPDPPKLDWSVWKDDPIEPTGEAGALFAKPSDDRGDAAGATAAASPSAADFLPTPADFDDGPEVIVDVRSEGVPGTAFDVSFPVEGDEPDTTPVLADDRSDTSVTVAPEDDEEQTGPRRRLWPLAIGAVVVLVVIGGFLWPSLQSKIGTETVDQIDDTAAMVADVAGGSVGAPESAEPAGQESGISDAQTEPTIDGAEEASDGGDLTLTEAVAVAQGTAAPAPAPEPEPKPEPEPAAPSVVELPPADAVTGIAVEPSDGGTTITITGNGSLEDGIISMETLASPPRVLVRVRGILTGYRPYTIEAATPEVTTVRSGLHEERRPPELWVVVDLTGPQVEVGGIDIRRDSARFALSRP